MTRAKFEEMNRDPFKETLKPIQRVRKDTDLAKKGVDEIVPVESSTRIPTGQSHIGGLPRGKTQERKEEMEDNMRCLYTKVTMPRSVHCGERCLIADWTVCTTW